MAFPVYRFSDFRLDLARRKIWRGDEELALTHRAFKCIVYLIENRDRAVSRDDLIEGIWGPVHLSDGAVTQAVLAARRALEDTGEVQRYIETVRGFGYRWVAPVESVEPREAAAEATAEAGGRSRLGRGPLWLWFLLAAVSVCGLIGGAVYVWRGGAASDHDSLASVMGGGDIALMLPVTIDDDEIDGRHAWIRLGLMDLIAERLRAAGQAMVPNDTVIGLLRGSSAEPDPEDLSRLAATTGARLVLAAHVHTTGTRWTVSLHSLLGAQPPLTAVGEAHDVLDAAHSVADRLAFTIGLTPAPEPEDEPGLRMLLQQIEAARLAEQMDLARTLIKGTPPRFSQHPEIRLQRGRIEFYSHRLDAAQAVYEPLLDETPAERDPVLRARVLNGLAGVHYSRGDVDAAVPILEEAARLLGEQYTLHTLGTIWMNLGTAAQDRGDFDAARGHIGEARRIFQGVGDIEGLANLDASAGVLEARRERYAAALSYFRNAAERSAAVHHVGGELIARTYLMKAHLQLLDVQAASAAQSLVEELVKQTTNPNFAVLADLNRVELLDTLGRGQAAKALLHELLNTTEARDDLRRYRVNALALLAEISLREGHATHAAEVAREVVEHLGTDSTWAHVEVQSRAWLVVVRAQLALANLPAAVRAAQAMTEWAHQGRARAPKIHAALARAEVEVVEGRRESAADLFGHALMLGDGAQMPRYFLQVAQTFIPWLLDEGPRGARDPKRALSVAERLTPYVDQHYDAALLQLRVYHAVGPDPAWRTALERARSLAGERQIPAALLIPPGSARTANEPRSS